MNYFHILNCLGLRERDGNRTGNGGGSFIYYSHAEKRKTQFRWDAAGINEDGSVTLIEEETGGISTLHIQAHLSRIPLMISFGENIKKLVWVINRNDYQQLKNIVEEWVISFSRLTSFTFPSIVYATVDGKTIEEEPGELVARERENIVGGNLAT